jgi:hypothetical protein
MSQRTEDSRYPIIGAVGPQVFWRQFWLVWCVVFAVIIAIKSGSLPLMFIAIIAVTVVVGSIGRKVLRTSWYVETDDKGFTVNYVVATYVWYEDLQAVDRNDDDVTLKFWEGVPLSLIPGLPIRRRSLRFKVADSERLVSVLNQHIHEAQSKVPPFTYGSKA